MAFISLKDGEEGVGEGRGEENTFVSLLIN